MLVSIAAQTVQNKSLPWGALGFYAYQHSQTTELTMQTPTFPSTIPLTRPLHDRLFEQLARVFDAMRSAWHRRNERRRLERELEGVADMNELLLRDMGAPEWIIAQAS